MNEILLVQDLAPKIKLFKVKSPDIAAKAQPGQFIILMTNEQGERIPITIADYDTNEGTITFVFNEVGKTTKQLGCFKQGDVIPTVAGPLGNPSEINRFGHVLCLAGGVMIAPMYLQVKMLRQAGNRITSVIGARKEDLIILEEKMKNASDEFYVATDDGSKGFHGLGFLTDLLRGKRFHRAIVMGPVITMKTVSDMTRPFKIPTIVTLTSIMIDGMGMCGACRVTVKGRTRFACIDGPEFDGHQVDFDELVKRKNVFATEERLSSMLWGKCNH
jgi:ferredoxin--NADP+ reductase